MTQPQEQQPTDIDLVDLDQAVEPIDDDTPDDEPPGEGDDEQGDATPRKVKW